MNREGNRQQDNGDWLWAAIYRMALPVWESFHGDVPTSELHKLEERSDWPCGLAAPVMKRISADKDLRKQLRAHLGWSTPSWERD